MNIAIKYKVRNIFDAFMLVHSFSLSVGIVLSGLNSNSFEFEQVCKTRKIKRLVSSLFPPSLSLLARRQNGPSLIPSFFFFSVCTATRPRAQAVAQWPPLPAQRLHPPWAIAAQRTPTRGEPTPATRLPFLADSLAPLVSSPVPVDHPGLHGNDPAPLLYSNRVETHHHRHFPSLVSVAVSGHYPNVLVEHCLALLLILPTYKAKAEPPLLSPFPILPHHITAA